MLEEQKPQRPNTYAKILNGTYTFKIVVGNTTDYKTYSIHYKVSDRTLIIVESEEEDFQKIYSFANGSIELDNITWELVDNSLVVHIPKAEKSDGKSSEAPNFGIMVLQLYGQWGAIGEEGTLAVIRCASLGLKTDW